MSVVFECPAHGQWHPINAGACPDCMRELRAENETLLTEARYRTHDTLVDAETIAALRAKVDKYEQWFAENGGVLAAHRIGGCYFGESKP